MNAAWTCPTCDAHVKTAYCPGCGEQPPAAHDLTLSGLAHQSLEALGHLDGRSIRTFRSLLTRPGELTADFVRGRRKPYLGPVQVFLLAFTATYFYASRRVFGVDRVARLLSSGADSGERGDLLCLPVRRLRDHVVHDVTATTRGRN